MPADDGFTLAERLDAGAYYFKVTRSGGESTGGYAIRMLKDEAMNEIVTRCSALAAPFSDPLFGCQWNLRNRASSVIRRAMTSGSRRSGLAATGRWHRHCGRGQRTARGPSRPDRQRGHESRPRLQRRRGRPAQPLPTPTEPRWPASSRRATTTSAAGESRHGRRCTGTTFCNPTWTPTWSTPRPGTWPRPRVQHSWGNPEGPGLTPADAGWEMAIDTGVTSGYGGKGVVYVWPRAMALPKTTRTSAGTRTTTASSRSAR